MESKVERFVDFHGGRATLRETPKGFHATSHTSNFVKVRDSFHTTRAAALAALRRDTDGLRKV